MALRKAKPYIPSFIWDTVRDIRTYGARVMTWFHILREVRGCSVEDRKILRRSARHDMVSSFRDLRSWKDPELLDDVKVNIRGVGTFQLRAKTDDLYAVLPAREVEVIAATRKQLRPGDTFVDAGANIGLFTMLAADLVGAAGSVIAIEMLPETAAILRKHIAMNDVGQARVVEAALTREAGMTVTATMPEGKFGQATIVGGEGSQSASGIEVQGATLSEVLEGVESVALMKMDLEGAELLALEGAGAALGRVRAIIFEQLGKEKEVEKLLIANGFRLEQLDPRNFLAVRNA